jgi:thiol-disulfide isomerase/thioredoxin
MLKTITLFVILLLTQTISAQTKGIRFVKTSLKNAFELAKKQNKPVFIEIYAIGCPHCENFKKTFDTNPNVGAYFNQRFISYQVEVNSPEGREFRKQHNIYVLSTPMMSFWSPDETLLHIQTSGDEQNNEASLKDMANRAIDPAKNSASWKIYFEQGVQEDNFLIEYAYMCRMICDTTQNIAAMNTFAQKQQSSNFQNPVNFLVLQKVVIDDENPLVKHVVNNLEAFFAKNGKKEVIATIENIVMYSLYSSRASNYSVGKLTEMKETLHKIGIDKQSIAGRFLLAESRALFKANQPEKAVEVISEFYKGVKTIDKKDADFIEKYVRGYTKDETVLSKLQWIFNKK